MTRLTWAAGPDPGYETGVEKGVLYPPAVPGVAWNGLVSIKESPIGGDMSAYHLDGAKYYDLLSSTDFHAVITAFSAPEEFASCLGNRKISSGFYLTRQPRVRFGLSYRTNVGKDGYKIHLVYNATATPAKRDYSTLSEKSSATPLEWTVETIPDEDQLLWRPTAHIVIDSRKVTNPASMVELELLLYGSDSPSDTPPELPTLQAVVSLMNE